MKNLTDISILLDRSGSMNKIKSDTIGGFNSFIEQQKKVSGECILSLYQFDDKYQTDYQGINIQHVSNLNSKTFAPRGWTRLLDALGKTINNTGERLSKLNEKDRPNKVIICVITDGLENDSKEFNQSKIRDMIKHQSDKYAWEFVFIGSNQDAIFTAKSYGIKQDSALTYADTSFGTLNAFNSLSSNVTSYRSGADIEISFKKVDRDIQDKELIKNKKYA